jgi:hypothetical protein
MEDSRAFLTTQQNMSSGLSLLGMIKEQQKLGKKYPRSMNGQGSW